MAILNGNPWSEDISGTADDDEIRGLGGSDWLSGGEGADLIEGGADEDNLYGEAGNDRLFGGSDYDELYGGLDDDSLDGGEGDDLVNGGAGDDRIEGGNGRDTLQFGPDVDGVTVDLVNGTAVGEGTDTVSGIERVEGTGGNDFLYGGAEDNAFEGGAGGDTLDGGEGNDDLDGDYRDSDSAGVDHLYGGGGDDFVTVGPNDVADGGTGFDTLKISLFRQADGATVDLTELWGGGTATVAGGTATGFESLYMISATDGEDVVIVGTSGTVREGYAPPFVFGEGGADHITGGGDRDGLMGGADNDILIGLGGHDGLSGNAGDDRLEGGAGDDRLIGSWGADLMIGGAGSDTYVYGTDGYADEDQIVEEGTDSGTDTILIHPWSAAVPDLAFTGVRNVEVAEIVTTTDIAGTEAVLGAEFEKSGIGTVIASADVDASALTAGIEIVVTRLNLRSLTVLGGSGDDLFRFGADTLPVFVRTISLNGGGGFDTIQIDHGGDELPGGAGGRLVFAGFERIVVGGGVAAVAVPGGDDIVGRSESHALVLTDAMMAPGTQFVVDATALRPDIAIWLGEDSELGGTVDAEDVITSDALMLDVSRLTGGRTVKVLGGAIADDLTGTGGDDAIFGNAGDDALKGAGGADSLEGGEGKDELVGGEGADQLAGGADDDLYFVDSSSDRVLEHAAQGTDTVRANASFVLSDNVEFLILTGGGNYSGTGNGSANTLSGNGAINRLDGKGGGDTMAGGLGHDTYVVDNIGDVVIENGSSGTDTVESSVDFRLPTHVEKLVLTGTAGRTGRGNSGDNNITGNSGANMINGSGGNDVIDAGAGNDLIYGSAGNDSLKGGAGLDRFLFNSALGTGNVDKILDFYVPNDTISLDRSIFTRSGPDGMLNGAAFHLGTAAADASDRIVYDQVSGNIFYDADGTGAGAQILFATVTAGTALSNADFLVYG